MSGHLRAVVRAAGPDAGHESSAEAAQSAAECRICKGGPEEGKLVRAVLLMSILQLLECVL